MILIINGPNLNMLKYRESIYGDISYESLIKHIKEKEENVEIFQSNYEGEIIDKIQSTIFSNEYEGIIINPAGYTHTSISILDALLLVKIPKVEVHLTDIESRETYRNFSVTKKGCDYFICGKGSDGYLEAIDIIKKNTKIN